MKKVLLSLILACLGTSLFAQVLLNQDFSGGIMPPTGWTIFGNTSNWVISQTNNAGGVIPEGRFKNTPAFTGYMRLISPLIDLSGQTFIILRMKHTFDGNSLDFAIDTRANYGAWNRVWSKSATGSFVGENIIIPINNSDVGSNKFQFCLYINGSAANFTNWFFDDISLSLPLAFDAGMASIDVPSLVTGVQPVFGKIFNGGLETINSADVSWQLENGDIHTTSLTNMNLTTALLYDFTCTEPIEVDPGNYDLKVWISNVNGSASGDNDITNDSLTKRIFVVSFIPQKKVVGEEATGSWCGWCVRGICFMDYMEETYPDTWIGIAVHDGDPMAITEYDNAIQHFLPGFPGFPSAVVDRMDGYVDPSELEDAYFDHITMISPASVSIENFSWDPGLRKVTFDVQSEFIMDIGKELRLAAVITEDSVHGSGTGYNQHNYYAGGSYGAMCGFESLPAVIPAEDMYYQHVARKIMTDPYGTTGSLPLQIVAGVKYKYTYSTTIPAEWNYDKLHFIGLLLDAETNEIINANNVISSWVSTGESIPVGKIKVYPNPANDKVTITSDKTSWINSIDMISLMGSTIRSFSGFSKGNASISLNTSDIPAGIYFLKITGETGQQMVRLVISH
jgi:hypothetical protein